MKKILSKKGSIAASFLTLAIVVFGIGFVPMPAHAVDFVICGQDGPVLANGRQACGFPELIQVISNIIDFLIFVAAPIIFVIVVLTGGVKILVSAGNSEALSEAKATIMKALTGMVIAMVAWMLVKFILEKLGVVTSVFPVFY